MPVKAEPAGSGSQVSALLSVKRSAESSPPAGTTQYVPGQEELARINAARTKSFRDVEVRDKFVTIEQAKGTIQAKERRMVLEKTGKYIG